MKKYIFFSLTFVIIQNLFAQPGRVGVNTTTPAATLHVADSSVLFTGFNPLPFIPAKPPVSGAGTRMMWYPDKAAFRAGNITNLQWDKDSIGTYSIAFGLNTKAKGSSSIAMGEGTTASERITTALGYFTKATEWYSTAMGSETIASGVASTAMGDETIASGSHSTAMGSVTIASGSSATAMGDGTTASGASSTATGSSNIASGVYSTATGIVTIASANASTTMGNATRAMGMNSTAMGSATKAKGVNSFSMGNQTIAGSFSTLSIGRFNDTTNMTDETSWISSDPVFVIGNGVSNVTRANAMTVLKNGRTGINVVSPEAALHIKNSSSFENHIVLQSNVNFLDRAFFRFENNHLVFQNTQNGGSFWDFRDHTGITRILMASNGDIDMKGDLTLGPFRSLGVNTTSPSAPAHVINNGNSGGSFHSKAIMILEDNDQSYLQFSNPTTEEAGILSGNSLSSIRSAFIFAADSSVVLRTGGNSPRMKIDKTGRTGINLTDPVAALDIKGFDGTTNNHIRMEDDNSSDFANLYYTGDLIFRNSRVGGDFYFKNDAGTNIFSLFESGNLTIGGTLTQNSDLRLKKNVQPLQNSLRKILSLGGYHYNWIDRSGDGKMQTGILAQEIEKQMPELVRTDEQGTKSVNYSGLIPYLIEAMKEQEKTITGQEKKIESLEREIKTIKDLLQHGKHVNSLF